MGKSNGGQTAIFAGGCFWGIEEYGCAMFFEIHDQTQVDRQGPDVGTQYRSEIFYLSFGQKETAERLIDILKKRGFRVATRLNPASKFYRA